MDERAVVITGASTGIGAAAARHLDDAGWRVFAGVRRDEDGERLQAGASERLHPVHLDVTDAASLAEAAAGVRKATGRAGLQGLVCNAGIGRGGPLELIDLDELRALLEVNVIGVVATLQQFLPMLRTGKGRVVIVGSVAGRVASPLLGPYAMSKHALEALADSLRIELQPWRIHVALLEPGSVATPIWTKAEDAVRLRPDAPKDAIRLYRRALDRAKPVVEEQRRRGIPAGRVADAITHALTSPHPRIRYVIGLDANVATRLRWALPDRLWDTVVARALGMPGHD